LVWRRRRGERGRLQIVHGLATICGCGESQWRREVVVVLHVQVCAKVAQSKPASADAQWSVVRDVSQVEGELPLFRSPDRSTSRFADLTNSPELGILFGDPDRHTMLTSAQKQENIEPSFQ
jgi:hypothetical protein